MTANPHSRTKVGRTVFVLAGLVILATIAILTWRVVQEIEAQGTAQSDNVQWSLSQAEVEFQEFNVRLQSGDDLKELRQRFDVFYSRVRTLRRAQVFSELRSDDAFASLLAELEAFLEASIPLIDVSDAELMENLPDLSAMADDLRPDVRAVANSGLRLFAERGDARRAAVTRMLTQLAVAVLVLISALALGLVYLSALINRISHREREQKQIAARINTILSTALDGVIVSDADGIITNFNSAAEAMFGHDAKNVLGKPLGGIVVPDHLRSAHDAGMERMRRNGKKHVVGQGRVQLEAKRADGTLFPVELALQSAITDEGEIFIAFLRDISKQVADEAELIEARDKAIAGEKIRSEFLATMSHEIRTPLNGLMGNMTLLRDSSLTARQESFLQNMETSGRLLLSHVSDVLDIARYDSGKIIARSEPFNVSALLQDIIDSQSGMALAQNTALDWGWDGTPQHWIVGDLERLQHVLMNLIGNAVKFTKNGRVSVTATWRADDGIIRFEIEDTGIGITEELQDRIFDDFVTGDTSYARDVGGTGLGLSIVKRFVDVLGGTVDMRSAPGKGSTFTVKLPGVPAEPSDATQQPEDAPDLSTPKRVLVIEDNEINRSVVRSMLERDGHHVSEATDGQVGVDMADAERFDLILMDISMPVLDGRRAAQHIRSGAGASADSRIVALTANALPEERADFLAHGMDAVLTKPLSRAALRTVLAGHTRHTASADPVLDVNHLEETKDALGEDNFHKMARRFCTELDEVSDWARADTDPDDLEEAAHKLAGSASLFGAGHLVSTLQDLETAAKARDMALTKGRVTAVKDLSAATRQALAALTEAKS